MNRWERRIRNTIKKVAQRYRTLPRESEQIEFSIHQARRLTKQLRSVLSLIPKEQQQFVQGRLRKQRRVARELGALRDESIFWRNFCELKLRLNAACVGSVDSRWEQAATGPDGSIPRLLDELAENADGIVRKLGKGKLSLSRLVIVGQFKRSVISFRQDFKKLNSESDLELWHEWRKSGKLLEYQLRLLRRWNAELQPVTDLVITLGKHLGRLNDLAKAEEAMVLQKSPAGNPLTISKAIRDEILKGVAEGCVIEKGEAAKLMKILAPQLKKILKIKPSKLIS